MSRPFHIGDILSITHEKLVSPRLIGGVYDLLGYMTGESLMTHQLPRASRECEANLRAQVPDLLGIEIPGNICDEETLHDWLDSVIEQYGETRDITPLPPGDHTVIDPIAELAMMRPDMPIIAIVADEGDDR